MAKRKFYASSRQESSTPGTSWTRNIPRRAAPRSDGQVFVSPALETRFVEPEVLAGSIGVWLATTQDHDSDPDALASWLAPDERDRTRRFAFRRDKVRFMVVRAALRQILSHYLCIPPYAVRFEYGPYGKPAIASSLNRGGLEFSVSHASAWSAIALALRYPIGIDIEDARWTARRSGIVERFSSAAERKAFAEVSPGRRGAGFLRWWTSKEAYVKGRGTGLSLSLKDFDVSVDPDEPPMLLRQSVDAAGAPWSLHEFVSVPGCGCVGALASTFVPKRVLSFRLPRELIAAGRWPDADA